MGLPERFGPPLRYSSGVLVAGLAGCLVSGLAPITAVTAVGALTIQCLLGRALRTSWDGGRDLQRPLAIAVDAIVGATATSMVHQFVIRAGGSHLLTFAAALSMAIGLLARRRRARLDESAWNSDGFIDAVRAAFTVVGLGLLLQGREIQWAFPAGAAFIVVGLCVASNRLRGIRARALRITGVTSSAALLSLAIADRPASWLLPDDRFFAGPSWALGEWGIWQNPFMLGEPLRYHWLSYAWLGNLSDLPGLRIYGDLHALGRLAVGTVLALASIGLLREIGTHRRIAIIAVGMVAFVDTPAWSTRGYGFHFNWTESFSQSASLAVSLTTLATTLHTVRRPRASVAGALWILGLTITTFATKTSTGIITAAAVFSIFARSTRGAQRGLVLLAISTTSLAASWAFGSSSQLDLRSLTTRPRWPLSIFGDLEHAFHGPLWQWVLLTLLILLTLSLPAIGLVVRIVGREKELGSWFLPMLALAGLIAAVGPGDDLNLYGLQIASGIGVLILTARVLESWTGERAPGSWRAVAILLVALILGRVDLAVGSTTAIRWWAMTRPVILLAAMILAVTLIMMTDRSRRRRLCPSDLLACAIIAAALATYPHPPSWRFTDGSSQWREIEASLQQTDRVALREFVGRVVPRDGILVTVDRIELADARRRQLFAIGGGPQFIPARLTLQDSLRSAIGRGDCRELARAVSRGGTHLVLARDQSALISSCFTRVYENASYVVYDLAKAP